MSSDFAIRLQGVSKAYTVYAKPRYWLAEFMGLGKLLREGRHYRQFWALRDIELEIPRGAKVALVGRNGAGKSTLLRIVSENVTPTAGRVEVHGHCEALMQLGTGFNPDFTGRECVAVALAYSGISGEEAEAKLQEVLDFSELDEFIEQPVRTYSSGMYVRLAFSVATMIAPEVLIIDEVLGAGDLYFQSKCLERMQRLASGPGSTVLFVSHDLDAAQRLCDTFVWIDRGRIVARGPAAEVRAAYEDSVRRQHELRLRARNLRLGPAAAAALERPDATGSHLAGQLTLDGGAEPAKGPDLHAIRLFVRGAMVEEIRVGDAMDDAAGAYPSFLIAEAGEGTWGPPARRDDRRCRAVRRPAAHAQGARFALFVHRDDFSDAAYRAELEIEYCDSVSTPTRVELHAGSAGMKTVLELEHRADLAWKTSRATLPNWLLSGALGAPPSEAGVTDKGAAQTETLVASNRRFGTQQLRIERLRFLDGDEREAFVFRYHSRMVVEASYRVEDPSLLGTRMICAAGIFGLDGLKLSAIVSSADEQQFEIAPTGTIRMAFDPLLLANGTYRFSIGLFSRMDLQGYDPYFITSPYLYDLLARSHEFVVEAAYPAESWLFRHPVEWQSR